MSKLLRIALAWLLAVALPLQGVAAQAMLTCGPAHHQSAEHHHSAASHDEAAAHDHGHDHSDKTQKSGHAGKCSACASCCAAVAMTTAVISVEVVPLHSALVATIPAGKPVESLGGLDRPPRPVNA